MSGNNSKAYIFFELVNGQNNPAARACMPLLIVQGVLCRGRFYRAPPVLGPDRALHRLGVRSASTGVIFRVIVGVVLVQCCTCTMKNGCVSYSLVYISWGADREIGPAVGRAASSSMAPHVNLPPAPFFFVSPGRNCMHSRSETTMDHTNGEVNGPADQTTIQIQLTSP